MSETCYWCGASATSNDHVPPAKFYPSGSKPFRITVPSCKEHNEQFSKLDERFRFYIQSVSESEIALKGFRDKTLRGIERPEAKGFAQSLAQAQSLVTIDEKERLAFEISPVAQDQFFEKICRGLFYNEEKEAFVGTVTTACSHLISPTVNYKSLIDLFRVESSKFKDGEETDGEVFSYRFMRVRESGMDGFMLVGCFYQAVLVFGLGVGTE